VVTVPRDGVSGRLAIRTPTAAVALALFVFVLLSLLAGLLVVQSYRDAVARAEDTARTAAHTVSAHVQWLMEASRQSLRRVDERLGDNASAPADGVAADLNAAVEALPGQTIMRVFGADGALTNSSERDRPVKSIAAAPYFTALRDGNEWVVTPLMTDEVTGEKVFAVGRRLQREGRFEGAAVLVVPALIMADFWSSLSLGPNSTVSIIGDDGWLVARFPVPAAAINLKDYVLFTTYLPQSPVGFYHAVSPSDGVSRVVGYRRVEGSPLIALASVSTDYALTEFRRQLVLGLLALLPAFLLLGGSAFWVVRLLRRDERNRERLSDAIVQNQLLFREIHHRVKNNLQAVSSLVQLQPISAEAKKEMRSRINAMAAVHEHIYNSDQFASVNAGEYIEKLAKGLSAGAGGNIGIETQAEAVALDPEDAMSLGLIVNEVVSNALKHGFPDGRQGTVRIAFCRSDGGGRAVLAIRDDGVGFSGDKAASETARKGMGLRLIQGLAERLGAQWAFRRKDGTVFDLSFPLSRAG
jgi:two-component system, sensor histidine kinase PdtaS